MRKRDEATDEEQEDSQAAPTPSMVAVPFGRRGLSPDLPAPTAI